MFCTRTSLSFNKPSSASVLPPPSTHPRQTKLIDRLRKSKDAETQKAKLDGESQREATQGRTMRKLMEQRLVGWSEKMKRKNILKETMDRLEMKAR